MPRNFYEAFRDLGDAPEHRVPLEKRWLGAVHASVLVGFVLNPIMGPVAFPLLVGLIADPKHRGVEDESYKAFNYGLTLSLLSVLGKLLAMAMGGGTRVWDGAIFTDFIITFVALVFFLRALKAARHVLSYEYPIAIQFVTHPAGRRDTGLQPGAPGSGVIFKSGVIRRPGVDPDPKLRRRLPSLRRHVRPSGQ